MKIETNKNFWFTEIFFRYKKQFYPYTDYEQLNGCTNSEIGTNNTVDKVDLKRICFEGNFVEDVRKSVLFTLAPEKPPGFEILYEPETKHCTEKQIHVSKYVSLSRKWESRQIGLSLLKLLLLL